MSIKLSIIFIVYSFLEIFETVGLKFKVIMTLQCVSRFIFYEMKVFIDFDLSVLVKDLHTGNIPNMVIGELKTYLFNYSPYRYADIQHIENNACIFKL